MITQTLTVQEIEIDRTERIIRVVSAYLTGEKKYKSHAVKQRKQDQELIEALKEKLLKLKK